MNSLQDLNNYANLPREYEDLRPANIIFDSEEGVNQIITFNSLTYNAIPNGIEIVEIVNYVLTNCQITFNIVSIPSNPLTGASLTWNAIPTGVTLTTVGQTYTLSGIDSVAAWNVIKNPNWIIPSDYASKIPWYVQVTISYFNEATGIVETRSYQVYDPRYTYDAKIDVNSNLTAIPLRFRPLQASLSAVSSFYLETNEALMTSTFELTASPIEVQVVDANLLATCSLQGTTTIIPAISSEIDLLRTYIANKENQIFAFNTPQITDTRSGTYTVVLTSPNGDFGTTLNSASSTLTLTGTKEVVNAAIAGIYFYPTAGYLGNTSVVWQQSRNGVLYKTKTITVDFASNNVEIKRYVYSTPGSYTFTPSFTEKRYFKIEMAAIGGGGPAQNLIGGNAGRISSAFYPSLLNTYNLVVGVAGGGVSGVSSISASGMTAVTGGAGTARPSNEFIVITAGQLVEGAWYPASAANTVVFSKGNGGANANNTWGFADKNGRISTGLSASSGPGYINHFRTEYSGEGGDNVSFDSYSFGRGGNGKLDIPSYPVIAEYTSSAGPTYTSHRFYITDGNVKTPNGSHRFGNGGDAPNGIGEPGAVIIVLKVKT